MQELIQSIIVMIISFVVGGLVLVVITSFSLKYFVKRVIKEITSDETKNRFSEWLEAVFIKATKNGLKDKKVKHAVLEILELVTDRVKGEK